LAGGQAAASGIVGQANAFSGALGTLGNYAMMQHQQQQQQNFLTNLLRPSSYGQPAFAGYTPQQPFTAMQPGMAGYAPNPSLPTGFF
jgi:hypothetical protein